MINAWKIVGITFMALFVLENAYIAWGMIELDKQTDNKQDCAYNFCNEATSYYYDTPTKMCYCFNGKEVLDKRLYP